MFCVESVYNDIIASLKAKNGEGPVSVAYTLQLSETSRSVLLDVPAAVRDRVQRQNYFCRFEKTINRDEDICTVEFKIRRRRT